MTRSTFACVAEQGLGDAVSARAGCASHRALLHGLGHTAPIAIAALNVVYFVGQLARGWVL